VSSLLTTINYWWWGWWLSKCFGKIDVLSIFIWQWSDVHQTAIHKNYQNIPNFVLLIELFWRNQIHPEITFNGRDPYHAKAILVAGTSFWEGQGGMGRGGAHLPPWIWKIVIFCVFAYKVLIFLHFAPPPPRKSVKILSPTWKKLKWRPWFVGI